MDFLLAGAFGGAVSLICLLGGYRAGRKPRAQKAAQPVGRMTLTLAASNVAAERALCDLDAIVARSRQPEPTRAKN